MSFPGSKLAAGLAVAVALAIGGPAAIADDTLAARGGALFEATDRNADGAVDGSEAFAAGSWVFARLDANGDGFLGPREASAASDRFAAYADGDEQRLIPRLIRLAVQYMDTNSDHWVTLHEFHGLGSYLFRDADADRDGRLIRAEFDPMLVRVTGYVAESRLTTADR
jgi:hypothetical protein